MNTVQLLARAIGRAPGSCRVLWFTAIFLGYAGLANASEHARDAAGLGSENERESWATESERGLFRIELSPRARRVGVGRFQVWELLLTNEQGQPVFPARFAIGGGMQGHGHGLPTQPKVTGYTAEGRYVIEGLKFNMAGDWTLLLAIEAKPDADGPLESDQARIELTVDY